MSKTEHVLKSMDLTQISDSIIGIRSGVGGGSLIGAVAQSEHSDTLLSTTIATSVSPVAVVQPTAVNQHQLMHSTLSSLPSSGGVSTSAIAPTPQPPPTITITSTDEDKTIDGMLDRISHDLDYLLNRTTEIPTRTSDATTTTTTYAIASNENHSRPKLGVHDVILEETEE